MQQNFLTSDYINTGTTKFISSKKFSFIKKCERIIVKREIWKKKKKETYFGTKQEIFSTKWLDINIICSLL